MVRKNFFRCMRERSRPDSECLGSSAHEGLCADSIVLPVAAHAGRKKAAVAVAHRILKLAYYIIRDGAEYREAGGDYYDRHHPVRS